MYLIYIAFSLYIFRVILIIVQETPKGAWICTWSVKNKGTRQQAINY